MKRWVLPISFATALLLVLVGGAYRGQACSGAPLHAGSALGRGMAVQLWDAQGRAAPGDLQEPKGTRSPIQEEEKQEERGEKPSKSSKSPFAAASEECTPRALALFIAWLKADAPGGATTATPSELGSRQHPPRAPPLRV